MLRHTDRREAAPGGPPSSRREDQARGGFAHDRLALAAIAVIAITAIAPLACSLNTRDRVAAFFLDVPARSTPRNGEASLNEPGHHQAADVSAVSGERSTGEPAWKRFGAVPVSRHPPYLERQCAACHDAESSMRVNASFMDDCRDCHDRYFGEEVGHVPVQRGQCFACHEAHLAWQPHLLTRSVYRTCMLCHKKPENLSPEMHAGDGVEDCTRCHDPHFGQGFMLKDSASPGTAKR